MANLNISAFKYPLGFIRVIEFLFVVIAIAAVNSWGVNVSFKCPADSAKAGETISVHSSTFSLSKTDVNTCNGTTVPDVLWTSDNNAGGSAGFFYFVNVTALIYVLIISFVYVVFWDQYQQEKRIALADLAVTALFFVLFFFCSSIWWAGCNTIGKATGTDELSSHLTKSDVFWNTETLEVTSNAGTSKLVISVLCDWVLVLSFAFNCWFVWKEIVPRQAENPSQIA